MEFFVRVTDGGDVPLDATSLVSVTFSSLPDLPSFNSEQISVFVDESEQIGTEVTRVRDSEIVMLHYSENALKLFPSTLFYNYSQPLKKILPNIILTRSLESLLSKEGQKLFPVFYGLVQQQTFTMSLLEIIAFLFLNEPFYSIYMFCISDTVIVNKIDC